ncbi:MAG: hypothetical protein ACI83N_001084 [Hydrogenophaga sp.]|jgi:hypothetical protein
MKDLLSQGIRVPKIKKCYSAKLGGGNRVKRSLACGIQDALAPHEVGSFSMRERQAVVFAASNRSYDSRPADQNEHKGRHAGSGALVCFQHGQA